MAGRLLRCGPRPDQRNSPDAIAGQLREICGAETEDDGLIFDLSELSIRPIRQDGDLGGLRASFLACLGSARIPVQVDFGFGDAITPAPSETVYPTLLDMPPPRILAYPRETVVAEKREALVKLKMENSRMKDFFDLWFIFTTFDDDPSALALAVRHTFEARNQPIPTDVPVALTDEFVNDPLKQQQWNVFLARIGAGQVALGEAIAVIRDAAMRLFEIARQ